MTLSTKTHSSIYKIPASFRDPAGFVYQENQMIYRKINPSGFLDYDFTHHSGLYAALVEKKYLVPHQEIHRDAEKIIIQPEKIPYITYPYEWCFSQLQDAALLTLHIQKLAMNFGMTLKDASAYNIQFHQGKPIFIDTLSFTKLEENTPWHAYQQFCQHFLGPLVLMAYTDLRLQKLLMNYVDGIPLDLVSALLPFKTRFKLGVYLHIHLHAKYQKKYEDSTPTSTRKKTISALQRHALLDSLQSSIQKLKLKQAKTQWGDYYSFTNYQSSAFTHKKNLLSAFLESIKPQTVLDLGGNDGTLSQLATQKNIACLSVDIDPIAVEKNYRASRNRQDAAMLPLIQDLTNPSASIGWHHLERDCFLARMKTDCVMALALIHHLAIHHNIPLDNIADYLAKIAPQLIIEFIPKTDSMVKKLLHTRQDIFPHYTLENFENVFSHYFRIIKKEKITNSDRVLYWMEIN